MWLTSCSSSTSSARSATSCETDPSAAPPKMMRVLVWPVRPNSIRGSGMLPGYIPAKHSPAWCKRWGWSADELTQAAGVVDRWRAVVFNGVVVEVAVAVDAIGPPGADPLGPWTQLGVGEGDAVITAVEADIGPVGGPLDVERNLPADGQAQSGVPRAQQLVHVRA